MTMTTVQEPFDIEEINRQIIDRLPELMDYFGIDYVEFNNTIKFMCPIHDSDNRASASIYKDSCNYVCWTKHCELNIGRTTYSFFKVLFNRKYSGGFVEWLEQFGIHSSPVSEENKACREFTRSVDKLSSSYDRDTIIYSRELIRKHLQIPCQYFVSRGFSPSVLKSHDVGLCTRKGSPAYMRATVPVYDLSGSNMVGYTARSINDQCPICGTYHYIRYPCPRNPTEHLWAVKWRHSQGFSSGKTLYNIWGVPQNNKSIILVEGPGDVWRLNEAGIYGCAGLFGCNLSQIQLEMILARQVENVILCLDADTAGREAAEKIQNRLNMYFNVKNLVPPAKDIGECSIEQIHTLLKGI